MPDASTLSDQELNEAVAFALGWKQCNYCRGAWYQTAVEYDNWHSDHWRRKDLPIGNVASSIDAVKQAEEKLHAAGWGVEIQNDWFDSESGERIPWVVCWYTMNNGVYHRAAAATEARARAEACLAALLALAASTPADTKE